jgi:hypothetical protein
MSRTSHWFQVALALLSVAMCCAAPAPAAANADKALVITHVNRPASCLGAIRINQIDGSQRRLPPQGFEIEPGVHRMTGSAVINTGMNCPIGRGVSRNNVQPLEHEFEAGMKYYVGFDHSSPSRDEWRIVVWKTEPR